MHVAEFLDSLVFVLHVEIVVARLPEWALLALNRHGQLQGLNGLAEWCIFWFADQQVNVLRHDDIAANNEIVAETDRLKGTLK